MVVSNVYEVVKRLLLQFGGCYNMQFWLYIKNIRHVIAFLLYATLQTCKIIMERNVSSDVQITDDTRLRERVSNISALSLVWQSWKREKIGCGNKVIGTEMPLSLPKSVQIKIMSTVATVPEWLQYLHSVQSMVLLDDFSQNY